MGGAGRAFPSGRCLPRWNVPATAAHFCIASNPESSGGLARSAMPSGPVFLYPRCWSVPSPLSDALEILCEGADSGTEPDHPDVMRFARGLPLAKALHPDTLLAFRMNGEPLTRSHGSPVRLIVPGWYGVCSVKWITPLEVLDGAFSGYFQSNKYTIRRREGPANARYA